MIFIPSTKSLPIYFKTTREIAACPGENLDRSSRYTVGQRERLLSSSPPSFPPGSPLRERDDDIIIPRCEDSRSVCRPEIVARREL